MSTYTFTINVEVSSDVSEDDVKEFLAFETGIYCSIDQNNPFVSEESDARISSGEIY